MMLKTTCLILRQTPFQEAGRILACFSPDYGRLDFLLKGAAAIGPKKFPSAGLFRELSVEFRPPQRSGTLLTMRNRELLNAFDSIALNTEHYLSACDFSAFILANTKPMLEMPETYAALKRLLSHLSKPENPVEPMLTLALFAYLDESGLIPEPEDPQRCAALEDLLNAARGGAIPVYTPEYWEKIRLWGKALLKHNRINLNL